MIWRWFIAILGIIFALSAGSAWGASMDPSDFSEIPIAAGDPKLKDEVGLPIENINSESDVPARVVFFKLNHVDDAAEYEVNIRPLNKGWAEPYKMKTAREKIRLRVTPGRYVVRTRSMDVKKMPGRWSEWKTFAVPFKQPLNIYPADGTKIEPKANVAEKLNFEWPRVPHAKAYRVKLYDGQGKLLRHVVTQQNWLPVTLEINSSYMWTLNPLLDLQEKESPLKAKLNHFVLTKPREELVPVKIRLSEKPHTIKYQFELVQMIDEEESNEPTIYEAHEPEFKARLAPSEYELRVRSFYEDQTFSSWGSPSRFWVQFPAPQLLSPGEGRVLDPTDDEKNKVHLRWQKMAGADHYKVFVFNETGAMVLQSESKTNDLTVELPHETKYRWSVIAFQKREKNRAPASVPEAAESFSIDHYKKLDLSISEEPSQLFAWDRNIFSQADYRSENADANHKIRQNILATTQEIAAGYWYRKTNYGGLITGGFSTLSIKGHTTYYKELGLLFGYRTLFGASARLRFWLGLGLKDTPEIVADPYTDQVSTQRISTWGPQALVTYLDSINESWGYQIYAGSYAGIQSMGTPNGLGGGQDLTYALSSYLTYRLTTNSTGLLGYTYQVDQASYKTSDPSGVPNKVAYRGHYLSLSLIWGLQQAQK